MSGAVRPVGGLAAVAEVQVFRMLFVGCDQGIERAGGRASVAALDLADARPELRRAEVGQLEVRPMVGLAAALLIVPPFLALPADPVDTLRQ
jgi:hypothetical protein